MHCQTRLLAVMLVFTLGVMSSVAVAQRLGQDEPGRFDFYVLSLSWSPSFCETASGSARQQCGPRPYSFVVHGLWPQFERGFPEFCQVPAPRLDNRIVSETLDLMPARNLVYHEWDAHGTCSGLGQRDYFDLVRRARAAVKIPAQFQNPQQAVSVTPDEVIETFVKTNEGLSRAAMLIDCDRSRLREVRICMTKELKFRSCGGSRRHTCRADTVLMPPVRGSLR